MAKMFKTCLLYTAGSFINILSYFAFSEALPRCMEKSEYGFALDNYYRSHNAVNLGTCLKSCIEDSKVICKSFTYASASGMCHLSTDTKTSKPQLFKAKSSSIYMSIIPALQNQQAVSSPSNTTASSNSFDQATFCIGKAEGDHPYPGDCKKYISCAAGNIAYVRECYDAFRAGICNDC